MPTNNWIGTGSALWQTNGNWSLGHTPSGGEDVTVTGNAAISGSITTLTLNSISFVGFTGSINFGGANMAVQSNFILAAGMTVTNPPGVFFFGDTVTGASSLTCAGKTLRFVQLADGVKTFTFNDDAIFSERFQVRAVQSFLITINQGAHVVTFATTVDGEGPWVNHAITAWNWSAGAKLVLAPTSTHVCGIQSVAGATLPPIQVDANTGTVQLGTANVAVSQMQHNSGAFDFNGFNISAPGGSGNWTTAGGSYVGPTGRTITIGGNFSDTAVSLAGGTWVVSGTAVAHNATITSTSFAGGTALNAADHCTNGGGNTNVNFGSPPRSSAFAYAR